MSARGGAQRQHRRRSRALPLLLAAGLTAGASCDWEHYALMNSVPAEGDPSLNPVVRVYLGVDGLTPRAVERARARGAFSGEGWEHARFLSMFPSTSDASWTRLLRTEPIAGYEYGYYDPESDRLVNEGVGGLLAHVLPPFEGSPFVPPEQSNPPAFYRGFDQHNAAYLDAAWSYGYPLLTLHQSLDALFLVLGGRSETATRFTGYVLQVDVIGHSLGEEAMVSAIVAISDKIAAFKRSHPERRFLFTLFSDHGVDFVEKPADKVIDFRQELRLAGVFPARSFAEGRVTRAPFAVPVLHTRVTYLALHAPPEHVTAVAERTSTRPSVDLLLARADPPPDAPVGAGSWRALWAGGERVLLFGYDEGRDVYWLPETFDEARLDVSPLPPAEATSPDAPPGWRAYRDEALFLATRDRTYPDLFFRARTALDPISVKHPADLIVSMSHPHVSVGFELPGAGEVATAGSHGSFEARGSAGSLLTEERALPPAVRSDQLLDLFPELRAHLQTKGLEIRPPTRGAELRLDVIDVAEATPSP